MGAEGPSCFVLGADSLLIECGEILIDRGYRILGVISDETRVNDWARRQGIPAIDPESDYAAVLREEPFDYFFSIANLSMVSSEVLQLPAKRAINFHDGPLPRYAGLNAPVWAILNRENSYGVTWHEMTDAADEGDILEQRIFDISPDETSVGLNTKCFQAAIESFVELADKLASGIASARPQDLSQRSYFGKHERPPQGCVLDFSGSAVELAALVRCLDFGRYVNPIGAATIQRGGHVLVITDAVARESDSDAAAGTIGAAGEEEIEVATGCGTLVLRGFAQLCGRAVSVGEARSRLSLEEGEALEGLSEQAAQKLTALAAGLSRAEPFWVHRLASIDPVEVPYLNAASVADSGEETGRVAVPVPERFRARFGAEATDAVVATVGVYLARLADKDDFTLSFRDVSMAEAGAGLEPWVSTHVPMRFRCDAGTGFEASRAATDHELGRIRTRASWLRDAVGRHPALRGRAELAAGTLPVVLEVCDEPARLTLPAGCALAFAIATTGEVCELAHDPARLSLENARRMAEQFGRFLEAACDDDAAPLARYPLLSDRERQRVLVGWNDSATHYPLDACVHELFESQVAQTPDVTAVVFEDRSLTYRELDHRASQLAARLRELGVGPDRLVGVFVERSIDLVVAIYGVLKAGGAYVPMDPSYPQGRIEYMIEDSKASVIITQEHLEESLPDSDAAVICIDRDWPAIAGLPSAKVCAEATSSNLAYVIYTSGSTGKPKGVMVEHRNVVNFFSGMDERVAHEPAGTDEPTGTWLAVTSLSFDISVLELFWTLARGFKVVLYDDPAAQASEPRLEPGGAMDMGLFFWGNDDGQGSKKYRLLLECAKFADQNGFSSVWTPERHFHAFGGPFPNAATISAAVAMVTSRVEIRSGCVVLPLHHPIRVAEEWAVVDNLSDGRVGIGVAAGWMPDDFVIRPEVYENKKKVMFDEIATLRRLWRGEAVPFKNGKGAPVETVTLPRPIQPEVPIWVTTAGNPESYEQAGEIGAHLLTHLLGQTVEEVAEKIVLYREARERAGFDPATGTVTLMLHTFVGEDDDQVRKLVRGPMKSYLGSAVSLVAKHAWTFPTYKPADGKTTDELDQLSEADIASLTQEEADTILEHAFERYFETSGLFGAVDTCVRMVERLKKIGVDEIGCLMDYGVPTDDVLASLPHLRRVRELANVDAEGGSERRNDSIPALVRRHEVTHLQCTPALARMLTLGEETREALRPLKQLMVGGEAFPASLAGELDGLVSGTVTNMYGPTETTIWSSTADVEATSESVSIGRPIANTSMYVLDSARQPVPVGVAGELYIGGDGVVRGYFERSELTSERFVADPFRGGDSRMYRTGDRARHRDDGTLEFLGRTDFQVKIRGYRVELGEIEDLLGKHESVGECVVVAREDTPGDQRLVAYLVAARTTPLPGELREHLRSQLPEYMVPAHFTILAQLPLTPNGKVDRKALPAPDASDQRAEVRYVEPADDLEQSLADLWKGTLGIAEVGVDDNFFDIGGHSLLVVRVHRSLPAVIEQPVSLTDLYRFPTIRSLANFMRGGDSAAAAAAAGSARGQKRREARQQRRRARR
jgi:natural product biosynthesis luciferase-like monooxygenase protein